MKNRRKDNKPTDDPEDVTSWDLPSQLEANDLSESTEFFVPPASSTLAPPPNFDGELPTLPPPPPPPPAPPVPPTAPGLFVDEPSAESWTAAAPSAEVRDFPDSAKTTTPFRPDRPQPASVIDLTTRTEHPYDDIYNLDDADAPLLGSSATDLTDITDVTDSANSEDADVDAIDVSDRISSVSEVRELPDDLRSALQIATTPSLGLPVLDKDPTPAVAPAASISSLAPPPTAQAAAIADLPAILTVDVVGSPAASLSGLFTDVLTDNGFRVDSVSETSILLTREAGTVTIDLAEQAEGCIVEVLGLPATAVKKLMLAGLLQIGYEMQASRTNETVLRNGQTSMVRIVVV